MSGTQVFCIRRSGYTLYLKAARIGCVAYELREERERLPPPAPALPA
jgi:hypothetical protein